MRLLIKVLIVSSVLFGATNLYANDSKLSKQVSINTKRLVIMNGVVGGSTVLPASQKINSLLREGNAPIYMYINSPGGSVLAGYYLINQMEKAQGLGVKFICVVDNMAASMAFQLLAHCDSRYAMKSSILLWHPVRVAIFMALITPQIAQSITNDLKYIEALMVPKLLKELNIDEKTFYQHYNAETLQYASEVNKSAPGFLNVVDTISNLVEMQQILAPVKVKPTEEESKKGHLTHNRPYEIVYIYDRHNN